MTQQNQQPLWAPSPERAAASGMAAFMRHAGFDDYEALWQWSVDRPEAFWPMVWDHCGAVGERGGRVLEHGDRMPGAVWFSEARLNYAENLLKHRDHADALVFWGEDKVRRKLSREALYAEVSRFQQALKAAGVGKGDRVAGYLPNMPETIVAMLAATALGAIWTSASPDFGVQGVLDRFGQIAPKVLVCVDGYWYNGKPVDCLAKNAEAVAQLPSVEKTVVVGYLSETPDVSAIRNGVRFADFVAPHAAGAVDFVRLPFDHPLFIMY